MSLAYLLELLEPLLLNTAQHFVSDGATALVQMASHELDQLKNAFPAAKQQVSDLAQQPVTVAQQVQVAQNHAQDILNAVSGLQTHLQAMVDASQPAQQ